VVFAGVLGLRGNFRGVRALSQLMRLAKSVVFASVPGLRGNFRGISAAASLGGRQKKRGFCQRAGSSAAALPSSLPPRDESPNKPWPGGHGYRI